MKRTFSLVLALAMLALSGCAAKTGGGDRAPEELTDRYVQAITQYRGEMVEYNPVVSEYNEENAMYLELLGLTQEDMTAFALSVSMMNVKAYGIAAVMPAAQARRPPVSAPSSPNWPTSSRTPLASW